MLGFGKNLTKIFEISFYQFVKGIHNSLNLLILQVKLNNMPFNFKEIDRVENIGKEDFIKHYYRPQIPVVIEKMTMDWPAFQKWDLNYIKDIAGDKIVPLYDDSPVKAEDGFNEAHTEMKLDDYIDLLQSEPTNLRIFLYNLMKEVPHLQRDFRYPDIGLKFMKNLPMLFFGGTNSHVFMHYDIDLANIFHFHFDGMKECILVAPQNTPYIYKVPHAVICREDINFADPDFKKFPALENIQPFKTTLSHGEMLYMPEKYWHYMKYLTPGFSMSLRSMAKNPKHFFEAVYNVLIMRKYDAWMRKRKGQSWIDYKNEKAIQNTHKHAKIYL